MPVINSISLCPVPQNEFAAIDYCVMEHAFACQNELGRLCDEVIYQNDLAARLKDAKLGAIATEVPIVVTHRTFSKTYYLDLVISNCAIYELKTTTQLVAEHQAQLLNYLLLGGVHHGKLVNFRPARVQSRFVNTTLNPSTQRQLEFVTALWEETDERSEELRQTFQNLLEDWGAFLELPIYVEALLHLLGGEEALTRMLPLRRNGIPLGQQSFSLLRPNVAFRVTALPEEDAQLYERQLRSLLSLTPLQAFQWMNMSQHRIHFVTLRK